MTKDPNGSTNAEVGLGNMAYRRCFSHMLLRTGLGIALLRGCRHVRHDNLRLGLAHARGRVRSTVVSVSKTGTNGPVATGRHRKQRRAKERAWRRTSNR